MRTAAVHSIEIEVTSKIGSGTEFTVKFPREPEENDIQNSK